jgi:hypothetical protein
VRSSIRVNVTRLVRQHTDGTFSSDILVVEQGGLLTGGSTMTYRVYSGPRGSQSISPLEKDRCLFKEFSILDEALGWARHINNGGRVALLIEAMTARG